MRWLALLLLPAIAHADVMEKRWSASMGYGAAVARARTDDTEVKPLIDLEIALRYRVTAPVQVGLALGGAVERYHGYAVVFGQVHYSLAAERAWNPYLSGGLGLGSGGGLFVRGGFGVERRFTSWGFTAEAHLSFVPSDPDLASQPIDLERFGAWSGGLTIAAHYHWGGSRKRRRFVP